MQTIRDPFCSCFRIYYILHCKVPGLGVVADVLTDFLEWVEDNAALGAIAFAAVYVFTTVCFIPGALLTLGAGLVFGRALGTGLGVLVGSVAVLVSFFVLRERVNSSAEGAKSKVAKLWALFYRHGPLGENHRSDTMFYSTQQ